MKKKISLIPFGTISAMMIIASGIVSFTETRFFFIPLSALFAITLIIGRFRLPYRETTLWVFLTALCAFILMHVERLTFPAFSCPKNDITTLTGRLVYDTAFSNAGNTVLSLKVSSCTNIYGNTTSATGVIPAVLSEKIDLCSGIILRVNGYFSDDIFIVSDFSIIDKKLICFLRERVIFFLRQRICPSDADGAALLSIQLILGKTEDGSSKIRNKATKCGCTHVLALSGMHLNVFARIFSFSKLLTASATLLFLFSAGPRPSLVRAALMILYGFLPINERLICTFLTQSLLFPFHMVNLGCVFAYASTFAIILIGPYITYSLSMKIPELISKILGPAIAVMLLNAPIQLFVSGIWYPSAIIAGPAASLIASASMYSGLMLMVFNNSAVVKKINDLTYEAMLFVFDKCSVISPSGLNGYLVLVFLVGVLLFTDYIQVLCFRKNPSLHHVK